MSLLSRALLALGSILLIHACYSAHEYSSLASLSPSSTAPSPPSSSPIFPPTTPQGTSTPPSSSSLPLDIALETLASVLLICIALVLGAEALCPIEWRVWAGGVEHGVQKTQIDGKAGGKGDVGAGAGAGVEGFEWLEGGRRRGFLDIRALRREFAGWMREGEGKR